MNSQELSQTYFPYEQTREVQDKLLNTVKAAISRKRCLIVHAPTGLGKTAAVLAPALKQAFDNGLTVFFLTSRHTQHKIAIDTLIQIQRKYKLNFKVADIVGKKWMCAQPGVHSLSSKDFSEYCKAMREDKVCEFYNNVRNKQKLSESTINALKRIKEPSHTEKVVKISIEQRVCPFEIASLLAAESIVIVADYNYIFNPRIRESFLKKIGKSIEESVIIIDEGHNLPARMRELMTENLTSYVLDRAQKEAEKHGYEELLEVLTEIRNILEELSEDLETERLVTKEEFVEKLEDFGDYGQLITQLETAGDQIREVQKQSFVRAIARFLEAWQGKDDGFVRILSKKFLSGKEIIVLSYRCLDPSLVTRGVVQSAHATIMMSGTLTPTSMYKDLSGFPEDTLEATYPSPFPKQNRLNLIIPDATTRYSLRGPEQFKKLGEIAAKIVNAVEGNILVFFPSYQLRDEVNEFFSKNCRKTTFLEVPHLSKKEKIGLMEKFKEHSTQGSALLAVHGGSFAEGIDLPGDFLKCVIVIGLPLQKPDLEAQALIKYYDKKFGKGLDYGYICPAFNKALQSAGRCIRSETDKGAIAFVDERYTWQNYYKNFPEDWSMTITRNYEEKVRFFFEHQDKKPLDSS